MNAVIILSGSNGRHTQWAMGVRSAKYWFPSQTDVSDYQKFCGLKQHILFFDSYGS